MENNSRDQNIKGFLERFGVLWGMPLHAQVLSIRADALEDRLKTDLTAYARSVLTSAVPEEKEEVNDDFRSYPEEGFNACREQTLRRGEEILGV